MLSPFSRLSFPHRGRRPIYFSPCLPCYNHLQHWNSNQPISRFFVPHVSARCGRTWSGFRKTINVPVQSRRARYFGTHHDPGWQARIPSMDHVRRNESTCSATRLMAFSLTRPPGTRVRDNARWRRFRLSFRADRHGATSTTGARLGDTEPPASAKHGSLSATQATLRPTLQESIAVFRSRLLVIWISEPGGHKDSGGGRCVDGGIGSTRTSDFEHRGG